MIGFFVIGFFINDFLITDFSIIGFLITEFFKNRLLYKRLRSLDGVARALHCVELKPCRLHVVLLS